MADDRRPPPPQRPRTAQEALEAARQAEKAQKEAEADAAARRELAQRVAEEARARFLEEKARKEAEQQRLAAQRAVEEQRQRAEAARREALRRQEEERDAEEQAARDRALATGPLRASHGRGGARAQGGDRTGGQVAPILEGKVRAILARLADDMEILELHGEIRPEVLGVLWQSHVKRARAEHDLPTLALALALATRFDQRPTTMLAARVLWGGKEWAVWVDTERKEVIAALSPADRYLTGL